MNECEHEHVLFSSDIYVKCDLWDVCVTWRYEQESKQGAENEKGYE